MTSIVVMGPSGAGKSAIGTLLSEALALPFVDADDLHSTANVAKMAAGEPLTDADRQPWLDLVGRTMAAAEGGVIVACSALRRDYRDRIRRSAPECVFVHLAGSREVLAGRMAEREGHFMPTTLLDSQLATLEPLEPDEAGLVVGIALRPAEIVARIVAELKTLG
jgi:carbohydrate kinase (thermoresistant glucokinase family)